MILHKICNKCNQVKDISNFYRREDTKDGYRHYCNDCEKQYNIINAERIKRIKLDYQHSKDGLLMQIYSIQKNKSKQRGHIPPTYTKGEFKKWVLDNINFEEIYNGWVNSGFKSDFRPSIDRLNDNLGYSFDNIRLVTWAENNKKGHEDKKNGINTKQSKAIFQYSMNGDFIKEYHSVRNAARELDVLSSNIRKCCQGKYKKAYGYIWKFKEG